MKVRQIRLRAKTKYVSVDGVSFLRDCVVKRCRTYESGCVICDGWRFRDEHGRFVRSFSELYNFMADERVERLIQEGA